MEFDFFLAEKLHMTVAQMRAEMSGEEYTYWAMYYARKAQRQQLESLTAQRSRTGR